MLNQPAQTYSDDDADGETQQAPSGVCRDGESRLHVSNVSVKALSILFEERNKLFFSHCPILFHGGANIVQQKSQEGRGCDE